MRIWKIENISQAPFEVEADYALQVFGAERSLGIPEGKVALATFTDDRGKQRVIIIGDFARATEVV